MRLLAGVAVAHGFVSFGGGVGVVLLVCVCLFRLFLCVLVLFVCFVVGRCVFGCDCVLLVLVGCYGGGSVRCV